MDSQQEQLAQLKASRDDAMRSAERMAFAYFNACPVEERSQAALTHEGIYCAIQIAGLFGRPASSALAAKSEVGDGHQ